MDLKREDIVGNLELQLSELEMLTSMFPEESELKIMDPGVVSDIQDYISGTIDITEVPKLEYLLTQNIGKEKVVLNVSLSHQYPEQLPQVSVQCANMNRNSHETMNLNLQQYLTSFETGALCIGTIIEWVKDNFGSYMVANIQLKPTVSASTDPGKTQPQRLWIQSHHIYSKTKIENIQDWAKEYCLTGFILPGKPGFICVEGVESKCQQWWQQVRSMNWQKITCRLEEYDSEKKFQTFENIALIRNSDQSDMKAFLKYLESHGCSHVFKEFFGFDRK